MKPNNDTPSIRFAGFTDAWEQRKLGEVAPLRGGYAFQSSHFKCEGIPIVKISNILQNGEVGGDFDYYDEISSDENFTLPDGAAVLAMSGATTGKVSILSNKEKKKIYQNQRVGYFSHCENIAYSFIQTITRSHLFTEQLKSVLVAGAQPNVSSKDIDNFEFYFPTSIFEQSRIGAFLTEIDSLITLHQRKYDQLVNIKKSMLEKMFPKNGELVPEVRFAGFTDAWEQRKFSELVLIERGGSPRPIDAFITDSPDGLNWIKIGDAPIQGQYITKTEEKIRPEGLSKTRVVQPGDLILSNSMSFGRPYIMGISGCIHDGWLLIRNTKEVFDLTFLCHLLGSGQMLEQYSTLAAGSTVNNLNKELVGSAIVKYPALEEQRKIGAYLERVDDLITLHQRKLERLQNIKKACLEKMFV